MRHNLLTSRWAGFAAAACIMIVVIAGCGSPAPRTAKTASAPTVVSRPMPSSSTPTYTSPVIIHAPQPTMIQPDPSYYAPPVTAWQGATGKTVILDAGHGGHDTGAIHHGLQEKDINLDLAMRTAANLRARGCNVVMTRSSDSFVALPERSAIANRHPNAIFVSIHVNALENDPGVTGIETFVLSTDTSGGSRGQVAANRFRAQGMDSVQGRQALANLAVQSTSQAPALAESLQRTLCGRLGEPNRGVKQKNLAVLRETYFGPAALVEVGFMSNPRSASQMRTDDWRRRTSDALTDGITDFLSRM